MAPYINLAVVAALGILLLVTGHRTHKRTQARTQQIRQQTEAARKTANAPIAAVIEIIERDRATDNTTGGSVIIPDDVRINGQSLLAPDDYPIIVHEITTRADELAHVTLTLFARRITIAAENDLT